MLLRPLEESVPRRSSRLRSAGALRILSTRRLSESYRSLVMALVPICRPTTDRQRC